MSAPGVNDSEQILSTLRADGSRRWLKPRLSPGRWLNRRRALGYALIALFVVLPHVRIAGKPALLLDVAHRQFTFFGTTLYPTDTFLLALLLLIVFLSLFFLTALFGRVWCGWACPQTVYLELVFRPIERFFEGAPGKKTKAGAWRRPAKIAVYVLLAFALAHTFLSYFVGTDALRVWMTRSPLEHPISFLIVAGVTGLMLFDFGFFREQLCIVACPYGRMQSVMLDKDSLIIGYDRLRGEPRGKMRKKPKGDVHLETVEPERGDCIDCHMCVTTCPTGIDIRDGLQLECVNCTQCIDACDSIMHKIGKPRGLIRYSSQRMLEGGQGALAAPACPCVSGHRDHPGDDPYHDARDARSGPRARVARSAGSRSRRSPTGASGTLCASSCRTARAKAWCVRRLGDRRRARCAGHRRAQPSYHRSRRPQHRDARRERASRGVRQRQGRRRHRDRERRTASVSRRPTTCSGRARR